MGRNKFALVTGRQAFISCAHYVVDEILAMVKEIFYHRVTDLTLSLSLSLFRRIHGLLRFLNDQNIIMS
jgi:hypothetical protein